MDDIVVECDSGNMGILDLSSYQRDLLAVVVEIGGGPGIEIKERMSELYEDSSYGRVYSNLDELSEMGLIGNGWITGRKKMYSTEEEAIELMSRYSDWLDSICNEVSGEVDSIADGLSMCSNEKED